MKPKISLIIPVYNVERYLRQCLDSALAQTLGDIEIIAVNDCSTDGSKAILDAYAAKDGRMKVFHLARNSGTHYARKFAVQKAAGDYIAFLDSDDYFARTDALEDIYARIEAAGVDMLLFSVEVLENDKPVKTPPFFLSYPNRLGSNREILGHSLGSIDFTWILWNKIYRSDVCRKAFSMSTDERLVFATDVYAFTLLAYCAQSFLGEITEPVISYRFDTGISTVPSAKNLVTRIDSFSKIKRLIGGFIGKDVEEKDREFFSSVMNERFSQMQADAILAPYLRLPFEERREVSEKLTAFYSEAEVEVFKSLQFRPAKKKKFSYLEYLKYRISSRLTTGETRARHKKKYEELRELKRNT